jgi:hypothetical protein
VDGRAPRARGRAGGAARCAGVVRAVEIVERVLADRGAPVYVRKQIVHNSHVVAELERRGAVFVDDVEEVPAGATVIFSAHGVSPAVRAAAAARRPEVIDATCPLVQRARARRSRARRVPHADDARGGRDVGRDRQPAPPLPQGRGAGLRRHLLRAIDGLGGATVSERTTAVEDVHFKLPRGL